MAERLSIKSGEKVIISTAVNLFEFNYHACSDIQLSSLIFCITASRYVASTALEFGAELFLRKSALVSEPSEVIAHVTISSYFLLHHFTLHSRNADQYWLQYKPFYAILLLYVVRDTGQIRGER